MALIDITNVVNVSVEIPPAGFAPYSVNNLVCFTKDTPLISVSNFAVYTSASAVASDWGTTSNTYKAAASVFSQSPNILTGGGYFVVVPMIISPSETLDEAMIRARSYIYYGGCSYTFPIASDEIALGAIAAESLGVMLFASSHTTGDLEGPSGWIYAVQAAGQTHTRCLFYTDSTQINAFRWGYAGRGMSTNFTASNTTLSMNLKQIVGVTADSGLDQTLVTAAKAVGADVYANIASRASVLSYGANGFYDDVYNLGWLVGALQVAGFNYLAQSATKIPQTEQGMDGLKGAYRTVCQQAVINGFVAAGTWNSPDTFGNPTDFTRNVSDFGYYIYTLPIAQQHEDDRAARIAPVASIALKYSGAVHSSNVIVYVNQ